MCDVWLLRVFILIKKGMKTKKPLNIRLGSFLLLLQAGDLLLYQSTASLTACLAASVGGGGGK